MRIGHFILVSQPDIAAKFKKLYGVDIVKSKYVTKEPKQKISIRDIQECMNTRVYKRGKGGVIKQVR
ncbi:MAG: hypothetical protein RR782_02595 [Clostridium sp.]